MTLPMRGIASMRRHAALLRAAAVAVACHLSAVASVAQALETPRGDVLLTISGDSVTRPNVGPKAKFDRAMLEAMTPAKRCTHTPWHTGCSHYRGPLLRDVLAAAGVQSDSIRVSALNGFEAEIPLSELQEYDVMLAMERDGEAMPVRDFGPLFVLYPFDDHPELLNETVRFRSVWHVFHIHAP